MSPLCRILLWALAFLLACTTAPAAAPTQPLSLTSLLPEMTDLARLAEFPAPAFVCRQFSSYDRASKAADQPGWYANNDVGQYIRTEQRVGRKELVMMDADGPGAIVRIWSANPKGSIRIYLDHADAPAIEAKMIDLLGGKYPGLPAPIAQETSKGWTLYLPIAYAKHCKVTGDEGGVYYHVNYRTYPAATSVTTYTADQLKAAADDVQRVARTLADSAQPPAAQDAKSLTIEPGQTALLLDLAGPRCIDTFTARFDASTPEAVLRALVVKMDFDGDHAVEAPLGDFFGAGPGFNAYRSLPLRVARDGADQVLTCQWPMPFRQSARVTVTNHGKEAAKFRAAFATTPYAWTDASLHFHAKWRADFDIPSNPHRDWNYLSVKGKGVFVGASFTIDNPVKDWWGEGDEKIYVDGEKFPSHFGTGTEDYFGYAWCSPQLFAHAYHNQPRCDGPGNFGRTSVNRWHVLDKIPFTTDFRFDMEIWHWKACQVNAAVTAYWYAAPGATDTFPAIRPEDVVLRPTPEFKEFKVAGALEGEKLKVLKSAGRVEPQDWEGDSAGRHLWWRQGAQPGETLALAFDAPAAGRYHVRARFLKAVDYGTFQLAINDRKAGDPIDFYNPKVILTDELDLGAFDLAAGPNTFTATVTGANPKAAKSYMLGLDYLRLDPAK